MIHIVRMLSSVTTSALLTLGTLSAAADAQPSIHVDSAWARLAPMGGQQGAGHGGSSPKGNGAVYVRIGNHGAEADALVSASSDASETVEVHEVIKDGSVMKMRPVPKVAVPAHGYLEMKPGGYHLMLLGLRRDLKPGDTVTVTLTFERAGAMSVDAPVR